MVRALLTAAILSAASASAACGGDAFTSGAGDDAGGSRDGAMPPMDAGPSNDVARIDASSIDGSPIDASPIDVFSEPPPSCSAAGYACVPAVPAGWQGPLEVYAGTTPLPACTSDFAESVDAYGELQAPTPTCGCACGASSITCTPPTMAFYDGMTCAATPVACTTLAITPGSCVPVDERSKCAPATYLDISVLGGSSASGPCTPQATQDVTPTSWGIQARACASTVAAAQLNCQAGQICAPTPGSGFDAKLCVSHAGDVPCPGGGYDVKHTFYAGVDDTRGCSGCTCATPSGGSCSFALEVYSSSNGSCTGTATSFTPGATCQGVNQPGDFLLNEASVAGTCGPSTSSPTGTATPTGAVTVCCPQ